MPPSSRRTPAPAPPACGATLVPAEISAMAATARLPPAEADAELEALALALEEARPPGKPLGEAPALRLLLGEGDCNREALGEALTV